MWLPPIMYKINTHHLSAVKNQVNNPDGRIVMTIYVNMYSTTSINIMSSLLRFINLLLR